jgi:glutathione S-transferase
MLELYWISGSPNSWRAMLGLELKQLDYASHRLDPGQGEHKRPAYLALNPRGKVPTLVDGQVVIYESLAILAYLEAKAAQPALFGATPRQTGFIWQRLFQVMNYAREPINDGVVRPLIRGQAGVEGKAIRRAARAAHQALEWVDSVLAATPYLAGDELSAADVAYMPIVVGLTRAGQCDDARDLDLGFDTLTGRYRAIGAWLARLETLPAYERSYPPHWRGN